MSVDHSEAPVSTQALNGPGPSPSSTVVDVEQLTWPVSYPGSDKVSAESLLAARSIQETSGRRTDTPVRKGFVRGTAANPAPMGQIYSGGRSGVVALKLYLALIWRCASAPYETDKPARGWATLLDLPEPATRGARRVAAALRTLEDHRLVTTERQAGHPSVVRLLDENGRGRPYGLPSTSHLRAIAGHRSKAEIASHVYFKVSTELWTAGYMQTLSGPGLVMLLILLAEQGGEGSRVWFSTDVFQDRYAISHQTRATGTKQLLDLNLLRIERESIATGIYADVFDPRRMRNIYHLRRAALNDVT